MDDIRLQMEGLEPEAVEDPEERDRVFCFQCDEEFLVEHVTDKEAWVCPACEHGNLNLHLHFIILGLLFAGLAITGFAATVWYAVSLPADEVSFWYLVWSCVHTTVSGYVVMAVLGDRRAYGLRALRYLFPGLYISAVGGALVYWFVQELHVIIPAGVAFLGVGLYGGYVFWHALRMAEPHSPRESVIRPMYTLISVTVHAILLLLFTKVAVSVMQRTPGTSSVEFGKPGGYVPQQIEIEEPKIEEEELELEEEQIEPDLQEIETPKIREEIDYTTDNLITFNKTEVEEKPRIRQVRRKPNPRYEQRYNRKDALEAGGGSDQTEWAVLQGLRWLKAHQNKDGSWGDPPVQPALTGLALLAFLGHGEDHLSDEFGETVRKAISWFVARQDEKGFFTQEHQWCYQHGMATYAMAEAYAMTGLEDLKPVVAKAVRLICEGQTPEGGWYYNYAKVKDQGSPWPGGDTSVCGWQIQAITAAWYGGIRYSDNMLRDTRRRAINDIKSRFSEESGCGYQGTTPNRSKEDNYCTTAVGTLCLQFLGQGSCEEVKDGLDIMRQYSCDWERTTGGSGGPLYGWYYVTQAMYHATANPKNNVYWKYWNPKFSTLLVNRQKGDGHWDYPEGGANSTVGRAWGNEMNKTIYSTAMCCLMLEVYYRYLPTYRH